MELLALWNLFCCIILSLIGIGVILFLTVVIIAFLVGIIKFARKELIKRNNNDR